MFLLVPGEKIAVYNTRTGENLWQHKLSYRDADEPGFLTLFITKNFCGYGEFSEKIPMFQIYNTNSGQRISRVKIKDYCSLIGYGNAVFNGPYLVYLTLDPPTVSVIQVDGEKVTKHHHFLIPMDKLTKTDHVSAERLQFPNITFMGHLPKSNMLIGQMYMFDQLSHLFSLDLDAALAARNESEIESAFNLLMASYYSIDGGGHMFKPVYKTDLARECVDLVGVMKEKRSADSGKILAVKKYFFVTGMQVPSEFH